MSTPKIIAYLKPSCGWSMGVNDPRQRMEMIQKSGQELSPCVEVNGKMLADISGEELERWMLQNNVVAVNNAPVDVPLNAPCSDAQHAAMAAASVPITFKN
jgi:hypothetical protein